ncbi:MAG TPA: S8 family serine peptidase [Longimicrobium sp.]|jgi:subtilisin family serine protease|uniref:S8 family peptidase n=1 Tax=Longimicrobium sp. TaxID=2029185 RepID=UPI002EDAC972
MKRNTFALASMIALAACADGQAPTAAVDEAPVLSQSASGRYVVVLKDGADPRSVAAVAGVSPRYVYTAALNGFAGTLNAGQLNALQHNSNVAYIEADLPMEKSTLQTGATWGLDRIDQRDLPLSTSFTYTSTGAGVNAYILDTGITLGHTEFVGRAVSGYDAVDGGSADDCDGHGTHVAGTVGGTTYGVAKGVKLVAVRVLDCAGSGTTSGVVAGIDWVTANHVKPAVANMSLGGGASTAIDDAVRRSVSAGVTYAVAAGNGTRAGRQDDACKYSPARVATAITVGATTSTDAKASYSNYGTCVDIFAPGSSIKSAWYTSATATNTISGTSMATPHVVGVIAQYLQGNPGATPAQVEAAIEGGATVGKVTSAGTGSPNLLLFTAF